MFFWTAKRTKKLSTELQSRGQLLSEVTTAPRTRHLRLLKQLGAPL